MKTTIIYVCLAFFFLLVNIFAETNDSTKYNYRFVLTDGAVLHAYRVAAERFYGKTDTEGYWPAEGNYEIQFTKKTDEPNTIDITFQLKSKGGQEDRSRITTRGGGATTIVVDMNKMVVVEEYLNK
jgi:hypothetical protein